jgi:hypothetical protein
VPLAGERFAGMKVGQHHVGEIKGRRATPRIILAATGARRLGRNGQVEGMGIDTSRCSARRPGHGALTIK